MRKIEILLLVLLISLNVACSSSKLETAEQATTNVLAAIKTLDQDTINKYMNYNDLVEQSEADNNGFQTKKIFENLEYKIVSSDEKENEAIIEVELTNIDMEKVMGDVMKNAIAEVFSQAFTSESKQLSEEENQQKMNRFLEEAIANNKDSKVTNTVDIKLNKVDGQWKINADELFLNAVTGNMLSVANQIEDSFGGTD